MDDSNAGLARDKLHFKDVTLDQRSFALVEVFTTAVGGFLTLNQTEENEEQLACWNFVRLFEDEPKITNRSRVSGISSIEDTDEEENIWILNTGAKELCLYSPPLLDPRQILASFKNPQYLSKCQRFEDAFLTSFIFNDKILPPALPMDIPVYKGEEKPPEAAWVQGKQQPSAPTSVFKSGDGFDLYVDAARFLPDNCAFAKVICQVYDIKYFKMKEEFESDINLDLDPHNPEFEHKFEFRDYTYPSTTALLFKIIMIDSITKQGSLLGVSVLPVFVKTGTWDKADVSDAQFCLNSGHFELKLFNQLKNQDRLTKTSAECPIPCASLLVRLLPAPCHADGQPKQASDFFEDQWESEGLLIRKPQYTQGAYDTSECQPNIMECRLFHAYVRRKPTTCRDAMRLVVEGRRAKNDQGLIDAVKNYVKNVNNLPRTDITFLSKYSSMHGIVFSIDAAQNLPWAGFTFASYCFSPPASFYKGKLDDPAVLTTKLDLDGYIRLPKWNDGMKVFPRRRSHTNMLVLVHLYELQLIPKENEVVFQLGAQAWTIIPICNEEFPYHGLYQVGIFHDVPSDAMIDAIQNEPIIQTIANLRKKKQIRIVDGASVFVRMGDARRREELDRPEKLAVKTTFLPRGNKFLNPVQSKRFTTIIPKDQNSEEYGKILSSKFRTLAGKIFQERLPR